MADLGKVDHELFSEYTYPWLGVAHDDAAFSSTHGVDSSFLDIDGTVVVIVTGPLPVLPALDLEYAGWFVIGTVLSGIVVSGLDPSYLAASFTFPPEMTDDQFAEFWGVIYGETDGLGASTAIGHTARYAGCSYPRVGGVTAPVVGDHNDTVHPDDAKSGDDALVTKGPGVETTGFLTMLFPDAFPDLDADVFATT